MPIIDPLFYLILTLLGLVLLYALFLAIRNEVVFHARAKAIDLLPNFPSKYADYLCDKIVFEDQHDQIWNFRKWTFKQFYPEMWESQNARVVFN